MLGEESRHAWVVGRILICLLSLYFFVCSLDTMASAGRLMAGKSASIFISESSILRNPIVGLMLGILATVLMQSSSTVTSIIVGLVAAGVIPVKNAIPMVMGTNVGTSITSSIVSITQIKDVSKFERAFSCAIVHDFFNWLTVIFLFTLEMVTQNSNGGVLYHLTDYLVNQIHFQNSSGHHPPKLLLAITAPLTSKIIQIDNTVIKGLALNESKYENITTLLPENCEKNETKFVSSPQYPDLSENVTELMNYSCGFLFANTGMSDMTLGIMLLLFSILALVICLIVLVKMLNSLWKERLAQYINENIITKEIPYVPWISGYLMIIFGALITFLIQSSSILTATITPLVGEGFLTLEKAYPITLGANIGTTTTGLLAALTAKPSELAPAIQIALCHLFFNVIGILTFYPIPFMRWPIPLAKAFGRKVSKHRWFALVYILLTFFLLPVYVVGLSFSPNSIVLYIGIIVPTISILLIAIINAMQAMETTWLPNKLKDWNFLPEWMRSLKPYDRFFPDMDCGHGRDEEKNYSNYDAQVRRNRIPLSNI